MERGRTFYISLASGILALALLLTSVNLPALLVIETKPYALVVLKSGNLDGWTAEQLGITSFQLNIVRNNYDKFLSGHRTTDDSNSESSDSSEDSYDQGIPDHLQNVTHGSVKNYQLEDDEDTNEDGNDGMEYEYRHGYQAGAASAKDKNVDGESRSKEYENGDKKARPVSESSSESSSSSSDEDEGEDSSDSVELTLEQKLKDKPVTRTVGLGLFRATLCNVLQTSERRCYTVSDNEAIFVMKQEVPYVENDINMPMWNNLRVESLFSVIACFFGLICLMASLKPCSDNRRLPVYLGSVSFFTSGVLVFIPIVRLLLISSDFEQSLATTMNVAARLLTPWSLVVSGIGAPLAFTASFTLIATKWYRITKKWYHVIKSHPDDLENIPNGDAMEIRMTTMNQSKPVTSMSKNEIYQSTEEKNASAEEG